MTELPISLSRHDRSHRLEMTQWLPLPPRELWPFFSDAHNLEHITPDTVKFNVLTPRPIAMEAGALIDYRLRIRGVPIRWRTKITIWEPVTRFVDEQLKGPYKLWRHEHRFEESAGGTLCRDRVDYRVPGGPLSPLIHAAVVKNDVRRIFAYRAVRLAEMFAEGKLMDQAPDESAAPG